MKFKKQIFLVAGIIVLGITLRLLVTTVGHNYDFDSYMIVLQIIKKSKSVYAETTRYNYGPIWFNIMWILYKLANLDRVLFRILLVLLLSVADICIFLILLKKYGIVIGCLFFLNPISILITGYHNQFDNLALLLVLCSVVIMGDNFAEPLNKRKFVGLILLGISLVTKHVFFMYPLWLAIKQKGFINKLWILLIPTALFLLSFIPYIDTGSAGIIQNVFLYRSYGNGVFYYFLLPLVIQLLITSEVFWVITLLYFAYYFRKVNGIESVLYYICVFVATAPAITNQYLVIPLPFIAVNINIFSVLYTLIGTIHLFIDIDGLNLLSGFENFGSFRHFFYLVLVLLLSATFTWVVLKNRQADQELI